MKRESTNQRVRALEGEPLPLAVELLALGPLTRAEGRVLVELARGSTKGEAAAALCRSTHTVARHVGALESKLGAHSHSGAVAQALARGLIRIAAALPCALLVVSLALPGDGSKARPPRPPRPVAVRTVRAT